MFMLLFVSAMYCLLTSLLKKCQFIHLLYPKVAQKFIIKVYYHSFFTVLSFWSQECASFVILCISCFSQSELS